MPGIVLALANLGSIRFRRKREDRRLENSKTKMAARQKYEKSIHRLLYWMAFTS